MEVVEWVLVGVSVRLRSLASHQPPWPSRSSGLKGFNISITDGEGRTTTTLIFASNCTKRGVWPKSAWWCDHGRCPQVLQKYVWDQVGSDCFHISQGYESSLEVGGKRLWAILLCLPGNRLLWPIPLRKVWHSKRRWTFATRFQRVFNKGTHDLTNFVSGMYR